MDDKIDGTLRGALAGLISSACCLAPLVILLIGVGNLSLAASMGAYRNYFIIAGISFVLLSIASHLRKKAKQCACSYKQLLKSESRFVATTLITFTLIFGLLNFAVIPYVTAIADSNKAAASPVSSSTQLRELRFRVYGMTCESCAEAIKVSLSKLNGVVKADVSYAEGVAVVVYDASIINQQEIVKKVPRPYSVRVLSDRLIE